VSVLYEELEYKTLELSKRIVAEIEFVHLDSLVDKQVLLLLKVNKSVPSV